MKMNCKKAEEYLVDYLYQELPAKKTLEIEKHLRSCTHCTGTLESWRAIHRAYQRSTEEPQVAPYTKQKILALAEEELLRRPSWKERFLWAFKIATVPIAIFVLVLFLNSKEKTTDVAMQKEAAPASEPVPEREQFEETANNRPHEALKGGRKLEVGDYEAKAKRRNEEAVLDRLASSLEQERSDKDVAQKKSDAYDYANANPTASSPAPSAAAPPPVAQENDGYRDQLADNKMAQKAAKISTVSKNVEEPFEKAQDEFQNNRVKEGQVILRQAIAQDDQKSLAGKLHQQGIEYQSQGKFGLAIPQYENVQTNYRDYAAMDDVLLRLGDSYAEVGQFDNAVQAYRQLSRGQQKVAVERIQRLQKKQEANEQLEALGYVGAKKEE